jgi:chaperonin GroES
MAKSKISLNPLDDRVVIRRLEAEEKTAGGIVLPDTAKEKPQKGEVLAVGPGKLIEATGKRVPPEVKVGDTVLFGKYSGNEVELEGDEIVIVRMDDILARF